MTVGHRVLGGPADAPNSRRPSRAACRTAVDYAFEAPDTVEAGITTFRLRNDGSQLHMAQLIPAPDGRSHAEHGMIQHVRVN
jgi:hypothetical protein